MTADALWLGGFTIVAILLGPVLAVLITRWIDNWRAQRARKLDVFRALMRTRGMPLHWDHVGALNLVEVEFIKHPEVLKAWNGYLRHLGEDLPPIERKDLHDQLAREREELRTKLISEIAKVLGIKVEQLEILKGNYVPQGWADEEWEQRLVRRGLIDLVHGRTSIAVRPHATEQSTSPYPPPPDANLR